MSTVTLSELVVPATEASVVTTQLTVAQDLGLPTTAWQPLGMARTIMAINANIVAQYSQTVSFLAQGGYASYAALMVDQNGNPITTWMDLISLNNYNVTRIPASQAAGVQVLSNSTGMVYPYSGNSPLRFQNPATGATYTTMGASSVAASTTTSVLIQADAAYAGHIGTSGAGVTLTMLTPLAGVTAQPLAASIVGSDAETNGALLTRCQSKLGAVSPNGATGAYDYVARTLPVFGSTLSDGSVFTAPTSANPYGVKAAVNRVSTALSIGSGVVGVYAANASGGLAGSAQDPVTNVTSSGSAPNFVVTVTTSYPHGMLPNDYAIIAGVKGATIVNNSVAGVPAWLVASTPSSTSFTFNLTAPAFGSAYTSGGYVEGGDLGMVDAAVQAACVPQGQLVLTHPASDYLVDVQCSVYIKTTAGVSETTATTNISDAIANFFGTLPIGGINAEATGILPWSEILTTIAAANPGTVSVVLSLPAGDIVLGTGFVPVLDSLNVTVVYV